MVMLPLIPKVTFQTVVRQDFDRNRLPLFYMNDFSRLGLRVHPCGEAVRLLAQHRYGVIRDDDGHSVFLEKAAQLPLLVELLIRNGIACEVMDVADAIYQG